MYIQFQITQIFQLSPMWRASTYLHRCILQSHLHSWNIRLCQWSICNKHSRTNFTIRWHMIKKYQDLKLTWFRKNITAEFKPIKLLENWPIINTCQRVRLVDLCVCVYIYIYIFMVLTSPFGELMEDQILQHY